MFSTYVVHKSYNSPFLRSMREKINSSLCIVIACSNVTALLLFMKTLSGLQSSKESLVGYKVLLHYKLAIAFMIVVYCRIYVCPIVLFLFLSVLLLTVGILLTEFILSFC